MSQRLRLYQFDFLRGWATLGVVVIHATAPLMVEMYNNHQQGPPFWVLTVFNQVARFCVPAFFIMAGFFTAYGKGTSFATLNDIRTNIQKRWPRLLLPYLTWSLAIYILPSIIRGQFNLPAAIWNLIIGSTFEGGYFLVVLLQLTVIGPFVLFFSKRWKNLPLLVILAALVASEGMFYVGIWGSSTIARIIIAGFSYSLSTFVPWTLFYVIGLLFAGNFEHWSLLLRAKRRWLALAALLFGLFSILEFAYILKVKGSMGMAADFHKLSSIAFALALFGYVVSYETQLGAWIKMAERIAEGAFAVYLMNGGIVLPLLRFAFFKSLFSQPLLVLLGLLVPLLIYFFSVRALPSWATIILFGSGGARQRQRPVQERVQEAS